MIWQFTAANNGKRPQHNCSFLNASNPLGFHLAKRIVMYYFLFCQMNWSKLFIFLNKSSSTTLFLKVNMTAESLFLCLWWCFVASTVQSSTNCCAICLCPCANSFGQQLLFISLFCKHKIILLFLWQPEFGLYRRGEEKGKHCTL